jgi:hypothetical protein
LVRLADLPVRGCAGAATSLAASKAEGAGKETWAAAALLLDIERVFV